MTKIPITEKLETMGEISKVRARILETLTESELFAHDRYEFCFNTLRHFDFPSLSLERKLSIEEAAATIVGLIGMDINSIKDLKLEEDPRLLDPINRYMHYFLEYDTLPNTEKELLEHQVNDDLNKVRTWIAEYEAKYPFLLMGEKPRNHGQKTIRDFYDRCKEEEKTIIKYQSNGLRERALAKASAHRSIDTIMLMFQDYYDRPYRLPIPGSTRYFKSQNIDLVSHRILPLSIKEGRILKQLYGTDKKQFYEAVEKKIPVTKLLDSLQSSIEWLPNVNPKRKEIFVELKTLYNNKNYWGFYALGVPQIEGIFLDMCKLCIPQFNSPLSALPDKVNYLRPFYKKSESVLDYFQYHVPNQRNAFLHYGTQDKEDIEILCKDLLFDLVEILNIFHALDTDSIWLNRLVKRRDIIDFSTIGSFTSYFELIGRVKQNKQYHYFEQFVESLKSNFFPDLILGVTYELVDTLNELQDKINQKFKNYPLPSGLIISFDTITNQQISENSISIKEHLTEVCQWNLKDEIKEILEIQDFLKVYKKHIDSKHLDPKIITALDSIADQFKDCLSKVKQIAIIIEFEKDKF